MSPSVSSALHFLLKTAGHIRLAPLLDPAEVPISFRFLSASDTHYSAGHTFDSRLQMFVSRSASVVFFDLGCFPRFVFFRRKENPMSSRRGFLRNVLAGAGAFASTKLLSAKESPMSGYQPRKNPPG